MSLAPAAPATPRARAPASALRVSATTLALAGITAVAAALRFVDLGQVPGNPFYDAAIRTMSGSWHAFLFGALDPGGMVSVDKPPVDLWLQVASVKLLGYSATAVKLPQALAGTASVPLVYDIVRRGFDRTAGLAAAAALAVLPVAVLTARSDTMDTAMAFLILVAAWLVVRAAETGRLLPLVGAGAAAGLAFNVKLFEALLPLPAIALIWLLGSATPWLRRIWMITAATAVMVVISFAWIVPVALTPASQRPYPIGSTNGSIWNLVFVFNGVDRLKGRPANTPDTLAPGSHVPAAIAKVQLARVRQRTSRTGPTRLLRPIYGPRIGTELLPAVLAGGLALLLGVVAIVRRRGFKTQRRLQVGLALAIGVWLLLACAVFSAGSAFHPRYFEAVSPAVAMALGVGTWALARRGRAGIALAAAIVALSAWYVAGLGPRATPAREIAPFVALAVVAALGVIAWRAPRWRNAPSLSTALVTAALLVVPAGVAAAVVHDRAYDAERSGSMPAGWPPLIDRYLRAHRDGTRYAFASIAPAKAAPLIVQDPQPVLMLTSYHSRPLVSLARVKELVNAGQVHYFLLGRRCTSALTKHTAACPATARWAIAHGRDVTRATGIGHSGLLYRVR